MRVDPGLSGSVNADLLARAAKAALRHQGVQGPAELTVVVMGDERIRQLNRTYRGVDAPTDVLSFWNQEHAGFVNPPGMPPYLGDVVLSLPRAGDQAVQAGHTVEAELQLLTVHGVLHLLGHDHAEPDQKAAMWGAQAEIVRELRAPVVDPTTELGQ